MISVEKTLLAAHIKYVRGGKYLLWFLGKPKQVLEASRGRLSALTDTALALLYILLQYLQCLLLGFQRYSTAMIQPCPFLLGFPLVHSHSLAFPGHTAKPGFPVVGHAEPSLLNMGHVCTSRRTVSILTLCGRVTVLHPC